MTTEVGKNPECDKYRITGLFLKINTVCYP